VDLKTVKKIAYVAALSDGPNSGAAKKIKDQISCWNNFGVSTTLYLVTDGQSKAQWANFPNVELFVSESNIYRPIHTMRIFQKISSMGYDVVYLRDGFPLIFTRVKKQLPIILEVQSLLYDELAKRSKLKSILLIMLDKIFLRKLAAFVFVSNEIANSKRFSKVTQKRKFIVIGNGISLRQHPILQLPNELSKPGFFFIGQDHQPWHGVDRILKLAELLQEFDFHLVGVTNKNESTAKNVIFYGPLSEDEYLPIAESCIVGLGTLNLEYKSMHEASSLKTREYLALGLPIIIRHTDTDFINNEEFILRLPQNDRDIVSFIDQIRDFAYAWKLARVPRSRIGHLESSVKELQRLEFIDEVTRAS